MLQKSKTEDPCELLEGQVAYCPPRILRRIRATPKGLDLCERGGWRVSNAIFLGDLACGFAGLERFDEAIATVDPAPVRAEGSREH